jgi:mRNA interferase MazF
VNRFFEWIGLKEKLHRSDHKPPFVSERDLWWTSLGENVGSEVNGKSGRFSRPVLIMRKLGARLLSRRPHNDEAA